jgi:glycosyltransferase involved in cell wall biosynthesis
LRVLHLVATSQLRGAEVFAADLMNALADSGLDQVVGVLHPGQTGQLTYPVTRMGPEPNGPGLPGIGIAPGALVAMRREVRMFRPDVVQLHGGEALKVAIVARLHHRTPLVYRRIGDLGQLQSARVRGFGYRRLMRHVARVVAVAESVKREVVETFRVPPERVVKIPNAVDPRRVLPIESRDEARRRLGLPLKAKVVLSLGALTWEKDPKEHLAVTAPVLAADPDVVHLLVGDGPLRGDVERAIQARSGGTQVRLLPTQADVRPILAASDVLLMASRSEGMPASVIEAGTSGLPVVAYALSGIPEVVIDRETGVLAAPGDRVGLARRLHELLEDQVRRKRLGTAAARRCRERFDIRIVARQYLDLYREVVEGTGVVHGAGHERRVG